MSAPLIQLQGVDKTYPYFRLEDVHLRLDAGQVMGFRARQRREVFRALGVPGITAGQGFVSLAVLVLVTVVLGGLALRRLARVG